MRPITMRCVALFVAVLACSAAPARADLYQFIASLDGLQETPPVATTGSGFGEVALESSTGMVTILSGNYFDLIGTSTLIHIHQAPAGVPGGVIVTLTLDAPGSTSGTFSGGGGPLTLAQMSDMIAGNTYINIHSTFKPGGEIRGQLALVPEPGSIVLFGCGALAVLAAVWRRRRKASV